MGSRPSGIHVDFGLEAKCYTPPTAVGVKDKSRLDDRRHTEENRWLKKELVAFVNLRFGVVSYSYARRAPLLQQRLVHLHRDEEAAYGDE